MIIELEAKTLEELDQKVWYNLKPQNKLVSIQKIIKKNAVKYIAFIYSPYDE